MRQIAKSQVNGPFRLRASTLTEGSVDMENTVAESCVDVGVSERRPRAHTYSGDVYADKEERYEQVQRKVKHRYDSF